MKYLFAFFLISVIGISHAEDGKVKIYGTHAFILLPHEFSFNEATLGYMDIRRKMFILGNHVAHSRDYVESSTDTPKEFVILPMSKRKAYIAMPMNNGLAMYSFMTVIGDENGCEVLAVATANPNPSDEDKRIMLDILDSAEYRKDSPLDFERLYFFSIKDLHGLAPSYASGPMIVFTPNGEPLEGNKLSLTIGRYPVPGGSKGRESAIIDYVQNPLRKKMEFKKKNIENKEVDGRPATIVDAVFLDGTKEVHQKLAAIFEDSRVTVLDEKSEDRNMDSNLNNFDSILSGFSLRK